ncbi:unnamed protein product [Scytosiphon promiscuus]
MVRSRTEPVSFCDVPSSKHSAFVVPAAAVVRRRSRIRQRASSCPLQQSPAAAAGPPPSSSRRRKQRPFCMIASCEGTATPDGALAARGRLRVGAVPASPGGGRGLRGSNNGIPGSDGRGSVNTSRNRMMAAAKRRRWTEVLDILAYWEENVGRLDAKTYNVALSALGKCGRWKEALATLERMRSRGIPPDVYSYNSAISACGRGAKWQQALALLSKMEGDESEVAPDLFSYNGAINAVAKAGRWEQALNLLVGISSRGLSPDVVSFSSAMSACDRAGEWQRALEILVLMLQQNVEPSIITYGTAISACARGGRWQTALNLLADISSTGLEPNAHVYGSAIHACVVGGQNARALALLGEMLERRVVPDAAVFTAAMAAVDGWGAALRLLEAMKREGVIPEVKTYNAALSVVARSGREDVALALLKQMQTDGYCPDAISFNTAIDACASRGRWREAVELLEVEMPAAKVKPDVISFTSVIHACAGPTGNWEKAYELLDAMWQDSEGPRPNKRTYDLVIKACGYGGEWELGVALIDDMRDLGIKPDAQTFNIAVDACARSGERLAAETLVANMRKARIASDEFTYASLVAACGRAKEWKRATEIFDEARYVQRIRPSLHIYGALFGSLAQGERWEDVLTYLDRMVADGVVPDAAATNTAVFAAAKLGDGFRALSLLGGEAGRESLRRRRRRRQEGKDPLQQQLEEDEGRRRRDVERDVGEGDEDEAGSDTLGQNQGREEEVLVREEEVLVREEEVLAREGNGRVEGSGVCDGGVAAIEERVEALLNKRMRVRSGAAGTKERGGRGAEGVRTVSERQLSRPNGGAAVQASAVVKTPSVLRQDREGEMAEKARRVAGEEEEGRRRIEGNDCSADGDAGGGWETATPGLLNAVLHALDEAGDDAGVLEAVKLGRQKGVLLNPNTYRCALKACGNLGDYNRANELLARMAEESLKPGTIHWNHALRASAARGRWEEAHARLREMKISDSTPDEFSYSMALKACSAGLWSSDLWTSESGWGAKREEAPCPRSRAAINSVGGEGERDRERGAAAAAAAAPCRGINAIELLQEMKESGVRLSAQSYTLAMAACLESHRDGSPEIRAGLEDKEGPAATDLRLSEAALSLFERLVGAGETPTASTYALALKACARTGNPRRAHSLFWAMLDGPPPVPPPATTKLPPASASQRKCSIEDGAEQQTQLSHYHVQRSEPRQEVRPWHLASAIAAYDAAGDWTGAQELWDQALRRGVSPRSPGYDAMVAAAMRAGDRAAARRLVDEARGLRLELAWSEEDILE